MCNAIPSADTDSGESALKIETVLVCAGIDSVTQSRGGWWGGGGAGAVAQW